MRIEEQAIVQLDRELRKGKFFENAVTAFREAVSDNGYLDIDTFCFVYSSEIKGFEWVRARRNRGKRFEMVRVLKNDRHFTDEAIMKIIRSRLITKIHLLDGQLAPYPPTVQAARESITEKLGMQEE